MAPLMLSTSVYCSVALPRPLNRVAKMMARTRVMRARMPLYEKSRTSSLQPGKGRGGVQVHEPAWERLTRRCARSWLRQAASAALGPGKHGAGPLF